jgi:hypothetical protein
LAKLVLSLMRFATICTWPTTACCTLTMCAGTRHWKMLQTTRSAESRTCWVAFPKEFEALLAIPAMSRESHKGR